MSPVLICFSYPHHIHAVERGQGIGEACHCSEIDLVPILPVKTRMRVELLSAYMIEAVGGAEADRQWEM